MQKSGFASDTKARLEMERQRREKEAADRQLLLRMAVQKLGKMPEFETFLDWLFEKTLHWAGTFQTNNLVTQYTIGKQDVGKELHNLLLNSDRGIYYRVTDRWVAKQRRKTDGRRNDADA